MSFVKVMIHSVWKTKNNQPFLTKDIKAKVIQHILQNAKTKGIFIDILNGDTDHLHSLFGLNAEMTLSKAIQLIKGESAYWINKEKLTRTKFEWADEYFAVSVSESMIDGVRDYIKNQEEHHKRKSFAEEYNEFIIKYGFNIK